MTEAVVTQAIDKRVFREAMAFLSARDSILAHLIQKYQDRPFPEPMGVLPSMIRAVLAQQISNRSAATLWSRMNQFLGSNQSVWADKILLTPETDLRVLGLNGRKVQSLKTIASNFHWGFWSEENFIRLTDQEVSRTVQTVKGLGPWSAASVLIFGLGRADVFPIEDFGVRVALCKHYFPDETAISVGRHLLKTRVKSIECTWRPYRTVATWFLWCSLENSS